MFLDGSSADDVREAAEKGIDSLKRVKILMDMEGLHFADIG